MNKSNWKWAIPGIALLIALVCMGCPDVNTTAEIAKGEPGSPANPVPQPGVPEYTTPPTNYTEEVRPAGGGVYDVIIVGAGSSGHAAMVAAVDTGAKVIVIEQLASPSPMMSAGIGAAESDLQKIADGQINDPATGAPNPNPNFTWFTKDGLFNALMEYSHYTANGPLVRRVVDMSGDTIQFLADRGLTSTLQMGSDQGMHWNENYYQTYHMHSGLSGGWGYLREYFNGAPGYNMLDFANTDFSLPFDQWAWISVNFPSQNTNPGTLKLNTRAIDLIMEEGKVAGVLAEDTRDHHPIKIYGKKVILCTGGYGPATEKFKELLELEQLEFYAYGGEGNTGSGIEMAVNTAGAKLWGDHSFMLHNNVARKADGSSGNELAGSALFFLYNWEAIPCVNTEGRRFMNEKLVSNSALWANASYGQGGTYFIVFNQGILDELKTSGIAQNMWYIGAVSDPADTTPNVTPFTAPTVSEINSAMSFGLMAGVFSVKSGFPVTADRFDGSAQAAADGNTLKAIDVAAEEFANQGWIYKGATLAELAANAGMSDPQVLVQTIQKYNLAVQDAAGKGFSPALPTIDEFGKSNEYLTHELDESEGPFYLMRLSLSSLGGSSGGIMVDNNLQVLDNSYHAIPGLYAAGLNAGGFYGPVSTYYDYEGSAMMFAVNSGRIAGTEAGTAAVNNR